MPDNQQRPADRRVEKTLRALCTALLEISRTKPVQKISVRDLCEYAEINRSTFYMHFEDKYHLMTYLLVKVSRECTFGGPVFDSSPLLTLMANERYKAFYKEVLEDPELLRIVHQLTVEDVRQQFKKLAGEKGCDPIQLDIMAEYQAGAILAVLTWWIEKGGDVPLEQLSQYFQLLPNPFQTDEKRSWRF